MQATLRPPDQHSPQLPEPSYASVVLTTMAAWMERVANRRRLLTEVGLRRAFTVAVAARLHQLPTAVADEVAARVARMLPDCGPVTTHGQYAAVLRQLAEDV